MIFKRLSRCIPKSFTDFFMKTISVPIENLVGILSDLFLVKIIDLNLSGLTIISLLENQFIATADSSFSTFIRSLTVLVKQGVIISKIIKESIFYVIKEIIKKSVQ